ncbi:hypothetical protein, partial [Acidithiobacillus ferrivorans]|uniref:hypothetical protein n=1 Tax=Acidithiobacillus ferrivorans TaxID=160808 RepID=UPI001C4006C6
TQAAKAAERSQGAPSFQEWAQGGPANALHDALEKPDATWRDLHEALAPYGMQIQTKGTGMVVTTELEKGRVLACPISKLDRNFTKMRLEQRLGVFIPPSPSSSQNPATTAVRRATYEEFLHKA